MYPRAWFFKKQKNQSHHGGDAKMRECKLCGKDTPELLGPYCGRCDKIVGDVNGGLAAELEPGEISVW